MTDMERAQKLFGNAVYGHSSDNNYFSRNRENETVFYCEMKTRSDDWPDVVSEVESLLHLVESVQPHKVPNHKVQADIVREINSLYRLIEQAYDNV